MSNEDFNDNLHNLIVDRLRERDRKIKTIKDYEHSKKRLPVLSVVGVLVAACIAGVFFYVASNQSNVEDSPIRSGMMNVQELINQGKYEEAIIVLENEVSIADSILIELGNKEKNDDEETLYEIETQKFKMEELRKEIDELKKKLK